MIQSRKAQTLVVRFAILAALSLPLVSQAQGQNDTVWTHIWNGTNLADWDIKFAGSALNVNLNNTFRVVDKNLEANYSGWTSFSNQYGHAGYKIRPFSFYLIRAEFQHFGTQPTGAPGWAKQNNGLMLHSQSVASMGLDQDFPVSMETQLLGSGNTESDNNSTMNLCTPGTAFYDAPTGGTRNDNHCTSASTNTRVGAEVWQWGSVLVMGDSIIRHYNGPSATGTPTLTYYRPVRATNSGAGGITIPMVNNERITGGYITIQAESHPYRFRAIDVMNLEGCMTVGSPNYKAYYVHHDAAACNVVNVGQGYAVDPHFKVSPAVANFLPVMQIRQLELFDMQGHMIYSQSVPAGIGEMRMPKLQGGTYFAKLTAREGNMTRRLVVF
ncbi:MAG: family 16 glycoside hydrolase [Fibrobacteria bacterium]